MKKFIVLGMLLVLTMASCSKEKSASAAGNDVTADNSHVVATVGGEKIMDTDVDALLSQIPEQARARYASPEGKREFIASLTEIKMMAMEAKKKGLDKTPDMKLKLGFMSDQILARGLAESSFAQIKISDEEVTKFYNENKEKFNTGPRVKLRHILVAGEPEAKAILVQLKKGGDFSKLAKEKSKCPSAQQGGDLGWSTKGMMVPEFEKAAFALKKGEMSGIVKTTFGYHIIISDDVDAGGPVDITEARETIERQIRNEKGETAIKALIEQAKKSTPVTVNEDYFKQAEAAGSAPMPGLELPPAAPGQPPTAADGTK